MAWLIVAFVLIVLVALWLTWTAMRIDRLNARVAAAWLSLDAALVRRSAALRAAVDAMPGYIDAPAASGIRAVVASALSAERPQRAAVENTISAVLTDLDLAALTPAAAGELTAACERVRVARTFYNDAVRAARTLRSQRVARWSGLARRATTEEYFDIDDTPGTVASR